MKPKKKDANPEDLLVLQEQNDKINALFSKAQGFRYRRFVENQRRTFFRKNSFEDIENKIAQLEKEITETSQSLLKKLKFYLKIENKRLQFL